MRMYKHYFPLSYFKQNLTPIYLHRFMPWPSRALDTQQNPHMTQNSLSWIRRTKLHCGFYARLDVSCLPRVRHGAGINTAVSCAPAILAKMWLIALGCGWSRTSLYCQGMEKHMCSEWMYAAPQLWAPTLPGSKGKNLYLQSDTLTVTLWKIHPTVSSDPCSSSRGCGDHWLACGLVHHLGISGLLFCNLL